MAENLFTEIDGIIHSKPAKTVIGKKGENKGKEIIIPSVVIEFTYKGSQKSQLLALQIARNVPIDDFSAGDHVIMTVAFESIPWKDDYITRARAIYIRHSDVDYNDTRDLRPQIPKKDKKDDVFVAPLPYAEPEDDNLPF
jgi:hypothetical protein